MTRLSKRRWVFVVLFLAMALVGASGWLWWAGGSGTINWATYQKLQPGMHYDEVHDLLGGRIYNVVPMQKADGSPTFKYGFSEDHESIFPPSPVIWIMVDNDNRLTTKEYEPPGPTAIWNRLVSKFNDATGRSPAPRPPPLLPPMPRIGPPPDDGPKW